MNTFNALHKYRRLVFAMTLMFLVVGLASWFTMARQEDPSFPYRTGMVKVVFPGATATQIEKLITEPLEEQLAEVDEIRRMRSISRDDVVIVIVELLDRIYDTDTAWDRVRIALDQAQQDFPAGVVELTLEDKRMDIPAVVLSLTGSDDLVALAEQAELLKKQLLRVPGVSRIEINGDPEKELRVELNTETLNQLGINRDQVVAAIQANNHIIPGGLIRLDGHSLRVVSGSDVRQLEDLKSVPLTLANGQQIPLNAVAHIHMAPREPKTAQSYHNGVRAISLGIITRRGQVDALAFGQSLRQKVDDIRTDFLPLDINETFFQPDYVAERLTGLQWSLAGSIAIIALVVIVALGWRNGLVVAAILPVVAIIALALYNLGGGILHQIAVIGMVISLGILVDNAIVVVESIEQNLQQGMSRRESVSATFSQMAMPLFSSTGTTVAAFIPLLLSKGGTGDFTRGIPVMIIISLIVSYFISVFVLPLVAEYLIRGRQKKTSQGLSRLSDFLVQVTRTKGKRVLLLVSVIMLAVLTLVPSLKLQFFPAADRNQLVLDLTLPSHVTIDETAAVSSDIERSLLAREEVTSIYRSVGASGFRFYYNLNAVPESPNTARLMINTANLAANQVLIHWIENSLQALHPEATLVAKRLGQGPPTPAPIELRLQSDDSQALYQATDQVLKILHEMSGTDMVRSDLDTGIAEMRVEVDKPTAEALGLRRDQIAAALFAQTRGLDAGEYRYADNPVTIRVRSESGEHTLPQTLASTSIYNAAGQPVPLDTVAKVSMGWNPAVIHHYQGQRTVTVLSELAPGAAYNEILNALNEALTVKPLPSGVKMQFGGDAEGSGDANSAILKTAPLGIMMLLLFMLLEFNSFKRLGIILVTIPLAAVGIIPGLVFSNSPFGFQSLLGVIALTGIVVNNAIVLLDAIDARLKEGIDIDDAVDAAIKARTAPVLLTTVTTVLGLLTLAFSESTLWPPMAWAIISGLLMSTLFTLLVIPILSRTFLRSKAI